MSNFNEYQKNINKYIEGQKLSLTKQGLDIMARSIKKLPVTRRETLSVLKKLPDDHNGETLKGSLRKLEQDILGSCYKSEIANIESHLPTSKGNSDTSQPEIWISLSRKKRMTIKLEHLRSLLKSDPLMDRKQRRREKRGMRQPRIALFP